MMGVFTVEELNKLDESWVACAKKLFTIAAENLDAQNPLYKKLHRTLGTYLDATDQAKNTRKHPKPKDQLIAGMAALQEATVKLSKIAHKMEKELPDLPKAEIGRLFTHGTETGEHSLGLFALNEALRNVAVIPSRHMETVRNMVEATLGEGGQQAVQDLLNTDGFKRLILTPGKNAPLPTGNEIIGFSTSHPGAPSIGGR